MILTNANSQVPLWLIVSLTAGLIPMALLIAWRLSGRLKRIQHGKTTFHFDEPSQKGKRQQP
jgi:hypothetical protein